MNVVDNFFERRAARIAYLEHRGEVLLDPILNEKGLAMSQLVDLGLLKTKSFLNTADLYDFELDREASQLLNYYGSEQIFTVKANRLHWFLDLLASSKDARKEDWDFREESILESEIND